MQEEKHYLFYALTIEGDLKTARYIGVTTTSIEKRFRSHKYCATHPAKCGLPIHKWMKSVYDKGHFITPIQIDECYGDIWEEKEKLLIKEYKAKGYLLLNLDEGGRGVITAEKRSKSSLQRCGEKHRKPITAFNLDGTFYKNFPSITAAMEELGIKHHTNLTNVLKGPGKSSFGYIWKYTSQCTEEELKNGIEEYSIDRHGRTLYQFDFKGNLVNKYDAIVDYTGKRSKHSSLIYAIEDKHSYDGYYWSFNDSINIEEFKFPYRYKVTKDGNIQYFLYQKDMEELVGLWRTTIARKFTEGSGRFEYNGFLVEKI